MLSEPEFPENMKLTLENFPLIMLPHGRWQVENPMRKACVKGHITQLEVRAWGRFPTLGPTLRSPQHCHIVFNTGILFQAYTETISKP